MPCKLFVFTNKTLYSHVKVAIEVLTDLASGLSSVLDRKRWSHDGKLLGRG